MKANKEYKNEALAALKGNWAPAVICSIVLTLVSCVVIAPSWTSNMSLMGMMGSFTLPASVSKVAAYSYVPAYILLIYPLVFGYMAAHVRLLREGDAELTANTFKDTFGGYLRNALAALLMYVFIFLWTLLFIIPGMIKMFAYSLTPYILKDYPELSANEAINLSKKMMKGHKFDLFYLMLSFLGWGILGVFTLGFGLLWLMPYTYTSMAAFYEDVKKDYLTNNN